MRANKGAAGADGLDIDQTAAMLRTAWPAIRDSLPGEGTYRPQPLRRVMIPKPGGGERELGIPTVLDRLIQQALLQVLQPILDPTFSQHSYGFRPGKSAHDAVLAAQSFVQSGRRVVVDVDLEKFFDRVDHDILIGRLRKKIPDPGVIRLVRAYLNADIVDGGVVIKRTKRHATGWGRCRRFWPMCCWMRWTRNSNGGAMRSAAMPTTATSMCDRGGRVNG